MNRELQQIDERIAGDREPVARSRMAARDAEPAILPAEAEDFAWEASVLAKLRKRFSGFE